MHFIVSFSLKVSQQPAPPQIYNPPPANNHYQQQQPQVTQQQYQQQYGAGQQQQQQPQQYNHAYNMPPQHTPMPHPHYAHLQGQY